MRTVAGDVAVSDVGSDGGEGDAGEPFTVARGAAARWAVADLTDVIPGLTRDPIHFAAGDAAAGLPGAFRRMRSPYCGRCGNQ